MHNRILKSFLFRALSAMVLLSAIGSVLIYRYMHRDFKDMLTQEMRGYVTQVIHKYPHPLSQEYPVRQQEIEGDARELMRKMNFLLLEVYDEKHDELAELHPKSKRFEEILHNLETKHNDLIIHDFPQGDQLTYNFFETEENAFLQIFYPLVHQGVKTGYIEGITLIRPMIVEQFHSAVITTILTVVVTVLVLGAVIFPLVYVAYKELRQKSTDLLYSNIQIIKSLGNAVAQRDSDTNEHNYRVTLYAVKLAEKIGLPATEMRALIQGSFLHDVGKIGISDSILLKPGKLDKEEFEIMKTHVSRGAEVISDIKWLQGCEAVIDCHHEKYDGSGYPQGLRGEQIPIIARIFAIVDVFDALTSKRPYKEPIAFEKAIQILQEGSNRHFDPQLLQVFLSISHELFQDVAKKNHHTLQQELFAHIEYYFLD